MGQPNQVSNPVAEHRTDRSEIAVREAKEYVLAAAHLLRSAAHEKDEGELERVAWMLEDTLLYLDRLESSEEASPTGLALLQKLEEMVGAE